ncbi:MAG: hypothetical protein Q9175_006576 [Cornicularia normoerica]
MTSSATSPSTLGDPRHGGALFTFPREVRDEIYRLVVRKHYIIYITQGTNDIITPRKNEHDSAILQVSKAVSDEASDTLYSESVFRFSIDFSAHGIFCVPTQLTNRMKNVEFDFRGLSALHSLLFPLYSFPTYHDHINTICHAAIADFTGTNIARNHLRIRLFACGPGMSGTLSGHIFERLKTLIGFCTVILEVIPLRVSLRAMGWPMGYQQEFWRLGKIEMNQIRQEILNILGPELGPAKKDQLGDAGCLVFQPREHMANRAR